MYNILVCDDEKDIVSALTIYLQAEGYQVFGASNGLQALETLRHEQIHLVLLDIMMPGLDGLHTMQRLREFSNVPVILLTAKSEDNDKILGLTAGADDYVTKPFNPIEVMARVKSQLRRYLQLGGGTVRSNVLHIGGIELDDDAKTVKLDGEAVNLTPKEYDILRFLMQNPGKVFPRAKFTAGSGTICRSTQTMRLPFTPSHPGKIEYNPAEPRYLKVVWGKGYKMEADSR